MKNTPVVDREKCTDCQLCVRDCVAKAIREENIEIIKEKCILCGHCSAICPVEAISINGSTGENIESVPKEMPQYFESLIKMRRSVRNYKDILISRKDIEQIIDAVNNSPTGTNSRMVGITVLDNREKINELSDIIMTHFDKITKILLNPLTFPLLVLIMGKKKTRKIFSYKKLISKYWDSGNILTHNAPLLMIFHADRKSSTPEQDGIIWSTTAMYYAESMGIGTCFNGFLVIGLKTCRKARKFIKLQKGHKVYETFTAGYPQFSYKRSVIKKDLLVSYI